MSHGAEASDASVRELAREILARDEYGLVQLDAESWRSALGWLESWLAWIERAQIESPLVYWAAVIGLGALALALIAHIAWTLSIALRMPVPEAVPARAEAGPGFLERAEALAAKGEFLEAARQVELATLELLLDRRWLRLRRSEPNRVLRRRLRESSLPEAERGALLALLARLERRLFREPAPDRALYEDWRSLHSRLHRLPALS